MKSLYLSLSQHLSETCPFLRTIDIDRGQLSTPYGESSRPEVAFPCLLIRISLQRRIDLTPYEQECDATITLTYATDRVSDTAQHINSPRRMEGLKPYDEVEAIYTALQGWDSEGEIAPLSRKSQEPLQLHKGLFAEQLTFETTFQQTL